MPRLSVAATLVAAATSLTAAACVLGTSVAWEWQPGFAVCGEPVSLRLDALSAFFLALLSLIAGSGSLYAQEYWPDAAHPRSAKAGRFWWNLLSLSLGIVLVTANGLHFLIGWELFTISAYFLVTLDRRSAAVRTAGWVYLTASHVAALCLFAMFGFIAARTGSWQLGDLRARPELASLFWLALAGFGIKAGVFPLHVWLPSAHANAPSHVSAMLSGMTLKMGIYGLMRFSGWLPVPAAAGWIIAAMGVISAVLGVAFALGQHDLKRLLAYHSVENIGIILIGLGFAMVATQQGGASWGRLALAGALLHVWNHGLFKSLLFFAAGSVNHATGTREMSLLGGLWRAMPWTTAFFALGAAAISGLPPLNGFVSEWLVSLGLFDATISRSPAAWAAIPAAILLSITGALALACFIKVCGVVFLGAPRSQAARNAHESGAAMRAAMMILASGCAVIGLAPVLFQPALLRVVNTWNPSWQDAAKPLALGAICQSNIVLASAALLAAVWLWRKARKSGMRRAITWDCGYAAPASRMQYTAGSFASTITGWFAWILRPVTEEKRPDGFFPASASLCVHTPETVLEYAVEPCGEKVLSLALAARRFQHGRVQAYLFYLLIGIAALLAVVLLGNNP